MFEPALSAIEHADARSPLIARTSRAAVSQHHRPARAATLTAYGCHGTQIRVATSRTLNSGVIGELVWRLSTPQRRREHWNAPTPWAITGAPKAVRDHGRAVAAGAPRAITDAPSPPGSLSRAVRDHRPPFTSSCMTASSPAELDNRRARGVPI
jgi:hypothetical protein